MQFTSRVFLSLTLVLGSLSAQAIPLVMPGPVESDSTNFSEEMTPPAEPKVTESFDISKPNTRKLQPELLLNETDFKDFLYVSAGMVQEESNPISLVAFKLFQRDQIRHEWGYVLDLLLPETAFLGGSYGYVFRRYKTLKPIALIELGLHLDPDEALNNFIDVDRYLLRVGGALSYHLHSRHSLRLETKWAQGLKESFVFFNLGYVWAWR